MRAALLALLVVAAVGCKKKSPASGVARAYRDSLCACKDMACANQVGEAMQKYVATQADPQDAELFREASECAQKLALAQSGPATGSGSGQPGMPSLPAKREADALISAARAWQKHPRMALAEVELSYVDADGLLDGEFGRMRVIFGASKTPVDDPKRRTGAPVKADESAPETCPTLYLQADGWANSDSFCTDIPSYIPKCTVVEIWKRAIKAGAPKDALAVITFKNGEQPSWWFRISDGPRNVNIANDFSDDCERTLEKSP